MKNKRFKMLMVRAGLIILAGNVYAAPNLNSCVQKQVTTVPLELNTVDQSSYEETLGVILNKLRDVMKQELPISGNNPSICHVLNISVNNGNHPGNQVIHMYIDHKEGYLYAVAETKGNSTKYYGQKEFLSPIVNAADKQVFGIEYPKGEDKFLHARTAQRLGFDTLAGFSMDHARKVFFDALTIVEASKMPSIEAAMVSTSLWQSDGNKQMLDAKKNYLQQYKCDKWLAANNHTTPQQKYAYLTNPSITLNDGIQAALELTSWYTDCDSSDAACMMRYITPSYAPQGSRAYNGEAHPCTK